MENLGNFREAVEVVLPYSTGFCSNISISRGFVFIRDQEIVVTMFLESKNFHFC